MSTSLFPKVVPEIDANPEHKKSKLLHASTTASSSSAMLKQARRGAARTTRHVTSRYVSWRDATSRIWALENNNKQTKMYLRLLSGLWRKLHPACFAWKAGT